jgi:hypothetical protein
MNCTHCGTRIADKALICYKCGNATVEARVVPLGRTRRTRGAVTGIVVIALLALLAWWLGYLL